MAYTNKNQLDNNGNLGEWTDVDEASTDPASFYVEDIILITQQDGYDPNQGIKKHKAKFWGNVGAVWVGYREGGQPLEDVIALRCPPFHPPNGGGPEVELTRNDKPPGFPNP